MSSSEYDSAYIREIAALPLLSADEEKELAREYHAGSETAKRKLIIGNLKLVVSIARSYSNRGVPLMDIVEEGNIGLIRAVEKFNPELGFRFSTYASYWIKQAMARAVANQGRTIRIPFHVYQLVNRFSRLDAMEEGTGSLNDEELAAKLRCSTRRAHLVRNLVQGIKSLDLMMSQGALKELYSEDRNRVQQTPEDLVLLQMTHDRLHRLLDELPERERAILRIRYGMFEDGEFHTLEETGKAFGITRERARQIEMKALRKLKILLDSGESGKRRKAGSPRSSGG